MCGALYRAVLRRLAIKKAVGNRNEKFREVKEMREGIHPAYYQAKVVCNCGNEFVTGSTKKDIHVEVCSKWLGFSGDIKLNLFVFFFFYFERTA